MFVLADTHEPSEEFRLFLVRPMLCALTCGVEVVWIRVIWLAPALEDLLGNGVVSMLALDAWGGCCWYSESEGRVGGRGLWMGGGRGGEVAIVSAVLWLEMGAESLAEGLVSLEGSLVVVGEIGCGSCAGDVPSRCCPGWSRGARPGWAGGRIASSTHCAISLTSAQNQHGQQTKHTCGRPSSPRNRSSPVHTQHATEPHPAQC